MYIGNIAHSYVFYGKIEVMSFKTVYILWYAVMRNDIRDDCHFADRFYRPIIPGQTNRNLRLLNFWMKNGI